MKLLNNLSKKKIGFILNNMKVENIISNGISHHSSIKEVVGGTLSTAISLYKMRHNEQEIFSKFPEGSYHPGRRFNDNDDVVIRICSALSRTARKEYLNNKTAYLNKDMSESDELMLQGIVNSFVDSLSGKEMDMIILDALRDCASSDHWYTFEKEWE